MATSEVNIFCRQMSGIESDKGYSYDDVSRIAKSLLDRVKSRPHIGIICGSGLGGLADVLENKEEISYSEIEGFPVSTVPGHAGRLVFGLLGGQQVVLMQGRAHLYEGYDVHKVGDIMIIKDHFNMPGFAAVNPLVGPNDDRFGPRFPPASQCYSLRLREILRKHAEKLGMNSFMQEGVYCFLGGMSTVPEVLVANHCGMEVCGISLITNSCVMEYDSKQVANHEEVLETGEKRAKDMQKLIGASVKLKKRLKY
ncbi:PNPH-like protein [Mya arenaria]|uniref:purine-nucleoside phosphorylase n=1 Tax=Mya arenaria TaxID=6604 RepID=A0ABY7EUI3_MYAAR|nr:PNPH-like protein [Mya arenaria]